MTHVLVTGGNPQMRGLTGNRVSEQIDGPFLTLGEVKGLGRLAQEQSWVTAGQISPRFSHYFVRRQLLREVDIVLAVPTISGQFLGENDDYYRVIRATQQLKHDAAREGTAFHLLSRIEGIAQLDAEIAYVLDEIDETIGA